MDLIAQINTLLAKSNQIFTVKTFFNNSLTDFFMRNLRYEMFAISTSQFLSSGLDLQKVLFCLNFSMKTKFRLIFKIIFLN